MEDLGKHEHRWKPKTLEELRQLLLQKRVPLLTHAMGSGYHEAVELCLTIATTAFDHDNPASSLQSAAQRSYIGHDVLTALGRWLCELSSIPDMIRPPFSS